MRRLECRQRTNSDVWIHHVACKFPGFLISLLHFTVIGNQLFISNDRNRVRWVVLGLLQDGACTDLVENLGVNSLKGDLSNTTTFNTPLFSLANTFNDGVWYLLVSATSLQCQWAPPLWCTVPIDTIYVFPEIKQRGFVSNSCIHVSLNDLYIPRISLPSKISRPILGIYKSLTDTWMWNLGDRTL